MIHYVLETQYSGVDIRVLVNGMELVHGTPAEPKITQEKINGWIIAGENKIQIYAAVPDPQHPVPPINIKCLLFRGPMGQQPDEKDAILRFAQDDKTKLPAGSMQMVWEKTFRPDPFYGPWTWETAQPITAGASVADGALGVIQAVITALNAHDSAAIVKLFHTYEDEFSRAYNRSVERSYAELKTWTETWKSVPAHPLLASDYVVLVEDNHLLLGVERKDGLPLFTVDPKAPGDGPKRLYFANTSTGWAIVR